MHALSRRVATSLAALLLLTGATAAQPLPARPITLVVPFAAGGPSDVVARLVGKSMSRTLRQDIVVENVAGAGGMTGAARTARAAPDGHTLLIHHLALPAALSFYSNLAGGHRRPAGNKSLITP